MKKLIGAILIVVLGGIVLQFAWNMQPKALPANVLITQPGQYRSPNGQFEVNIWRGKDGRLKYFFSDSKSNGGGPTKSFAQDSNWFMCWNSAGELWVYVADHDPKYCHCCYARENGSGVRTAGELGGWDGISETFKARLPVDIQEMCAAASVVKSP